MATRTNPQQWAEKLARRATAAASDYQAGVQRVQIAPTLAAADNLEKYAAGINEALTSGRTENRLRAVSLEEWRSATLGKGVSRYTQGIQAAGPKMVRAATVLLNRITQAQAAIANMPDTSVEDRIARSAAFQRAMHQSYQSGD